MNARRTLLLALVTLAAGCTAKGKAPDKDASPPYMFPHSPHVENDVKCLECHKGVDDAAKLDPAVRHVKLDVKSKVCADCHEAADGFDVVVEAAGARLALRQAFDLVRPGGTIVQVGTLGTEDVPLPANQLMTREITFLGSFRYGDVFDDAIRLAAAGYVDLAALVSEVFPLAEAAQALTRAADPGSVIKVQLQVEENA